MPAAKEAVMPPMCQAIMQEQSLWGCGVCAPLTPSGVVPNDVHGVHAEIGCQMHSLYGRGDAALDLSEWVKEFGFEAVLTLLH